MSLRQEIKMIVDAYGAHAKTVQHNAAVLDIYEGNLLAYVDKDLRAQFTSDQSYSQCRQRLAPINLLQKIVDKTSTIYQPGPARRVIGNDADKELFAWYVEKMNPNEAMADAADLMTMCKSALLQPYLHERLPRLRAVQSDKFFVHSTDPVDPMTPTHVVTFHACDDGKVAFQAYTKTEFLAFNSDGEIDAAAMAAIKNPEGVNPLEVIPFVYAAASRFRLNPTPDSDLLTMTRLIPLLFTDLNYAVMFQAFSILYGIDLDDENLAMAPNAFWRLKSKPGAVGQETKPELGQIKPQVDIDPVLGLIQTELSLWLNTRGIRPGTIGQLSGDNFANGISKMIDEMDTAEARQWLADKFAQVEAKLWHRIMHELHPKWVANGLIDNAAKFSPKAAVEIVFPAQTPMVSRTQMLTESKMAIETGLSTRRRELKRHNPLLSEEEIDALIVEINDEKAARSIAQGEEGEDKQEDDEEEGAA